jgi:hypothetical protein
MKAPVSFSTMSQYSKAIFRSMLDCTHQTPHIDDSTDECIVGATAADILDDVGISSLALLLIYGTDRLLFMASFLSPHSFRYYLLLLVQTLSPTFSNHGSTCSSPSPVPPPFNTTSTLCSRSMPHNSYPKHTSSGFGANDTSAAHVSVA